MSYYESYMGKLEKKEREIEKDIYIHLKKLVVIRLKKGIKMNFTKQFKALKNLFESVLCQSDTCRMAPKPFPFVDNQYRMVL